MNLTSASRQLLALALLAVLVLTPGCTTRSISDSGYRRDGYGHAPQNPFYQGELSEFDLLGLQRGDEPTDAQIRERLAQTQTVRVRRGARLLLIQSGALLPDGSMLAAMNKYFSVVPFSGQPAATNGPTYAGALRMAAARAGCEIIVCYWGALESAIARHESKVVSWVPLVGAAVPDETQHLRIRLKLAVVDTASGDWTLLAPEPIEARALSAGFNRETSDQRQVETLKQRGYEAAVLELIRVTAN
jgi:hypothetical protein